MSGSVRSAVVRISADVSGLIAGYSKAKVATEDLAKSAVSLSEKHKKAINTVATGAGIMGAAAAAGLVAAVKTAADFDAKMSEVKAATNDGAQQMDLLRAAAIKAGAATVFSAGEAADGITNLAKAGISTTDILHGGLTGALALASAGQIDVASAAEYTATALTQFGLKGTQASHVADLLSAGANKAQGDVSDMATALNYAGIPAAQLGVSIEQTAGTIALFAKNGLIGSMAGTSLRGVLSSITSPSKQAQKVMSDLGISVFDAHGKFIGLDGVAQQLHTHMSGLTQEERSNALGRMFGNQQLQAANILYKNGAAGVDTWTKKVNDSGNATRTAATKMDNLKGDIEQLSGSLQTALIGTGEGAQTPLRSLTQELTKVVNGYIALGPAAQQNVAKTLGAVALLGGTGFVIGKTVIGINNAKNALKDLGVTSGRVSTSLKAAGWVGFAVALDQGRSHLADWARSFDDAAPSVTTLTTDLREFKRYGDLQWLNQDVQGLPQLFSDLTSGVGNAAQKTQTFMGSIPLIGGSIVDQIDFIDQVTGHHVSNLRTAQKTVANIDAALANTASKSPAAARQMFAPIAAEAHAAGVSMKDLMKLFPQYEALLHHGSQSKANMIDFADLGAGLHSLQLYRSELMKLPRNVLTKVVNPNLLNTTKQVEALAKQYKGLSAHDVKVIMQARDFASPQIRAVLKELGLVDKQHPKPKIDADNTPATNRYRQTKSQLLELGHMHPNSTIDGNNRQLMNAVQQSLVNLTGLDRKQVTATIDANASQAMSAVAAVRSAIGSLVSHPWSVFVGTTGPGATHHADGGIVEYYAKGGLREHHVAQIAPAGAMRIWAEPETGGEAYIPLAASKRDRSRAIASEVVARLGGQARFANGGISAPVNAVRTYTAGGGRSGPLAMECTFSIPELGVKRIRATMYEVGRQAARQEIDDNESFHQAMAGRGPR